MSDVRWVYQEKEGVNVSVFLINPKLQTWYLGGYTKEDCVRYECTYM